MFTKILMWWGIICSLILAVMVYSLIIQSARLQHEVNTLNTALEANGLDNEAIQQYMDDGNIAPTVIRLRKHEWLREEAGGMQEVDTY